MTTQINAPPAVDYAPLELQRELRVMQELTIEEFLILLKVKFQKVSKNYISTVRKKSK